MKRELSETLRERAAGVRKAQRTIGSAPAERRTAALRVLRAVLVRSRSEISRANEEDLARAAEEGLSGPLLHRLGLRDAKFESLLEGIDALVEGEDPIDRVLTRTELDEGLVLELVRSPLGVLLIIFESRPDAVIQIGSLAIRSGNGVIMKGGREAARSNEVLVGCLQRALEEAGLDPRAVLGVPDRRDVDELLALDDLIDLVIPRGSGALVRSIQDRSRIPVLGHAEGVCHLYVDASADPGMAVRLAVDGKCDYPAACNATETLLVHESFLSRLGPIGEALRERGVELRCDEPSRRVLPWSEAASEEDWGLEFGDLTLAVRTVGSLEEAVDFIHTHGSSHTDAIVAEDGEVAERFLKAVDAASVFHNASTRFADGFRYGLGAEVGISTARIHARGPVGVEGLLTTRWLLRGEGQAAADYGPGKRAFTHRPLDAGNSGG